MNRYTVSWDFAKFVPRWDSRFADLFGRNNEGAPVMAKTEKDAIKLIADSNKLNGFYLKANFLGEEK